MHHDRAVLLIDSLGAGVGGGLLVALLCLLYLPTAAVWGLAFVVGPGFAVGAGTTVSVGGTDLGAVPAFPLLAALPQEPGPAWAPVVLLVPVAAGVVAGLLCRRSGAVADGRAGARSPRPPRSLAACSRERSPCSACSRPDRPGPGRLGETGPTWWLVAVLAGLEVAAVMAATLLVLRRR